MQKGFGDLHKRGFHFYIVVVAVAVVVAAVH